MTVPGTRWTIVAEYQDWSQKTRIRCESESRNVPVGEITAETVVRARRPEDSEDFRELLIEETQSPFWPAAADPFWGEFFDAVRDAHYAAEVVLD